MRSGPHRAALQHVTRPLAEHLQEQIIAPPEEKGNSVSRARQSQHLPVVLPRQLEAESSVRDCCILVLLVNRK